MESDQCLQLPPPRGRGHPHQEVAYALATAIGVLDAVRDSGQIPEGDFPEVVGRISFFVNAGVRFVEETCKMRAFTALWERVCTERYGVTDPKLIRFRYGVQVNSLGLTEAQPENNVPRIVLESLGVTLSKRARARAMRLPAWNEALGLPRPWDHSGPCASSRSSPSNRTCSNTVTSSTVRWSSKRRRPKWPRPHGRSSGRAGLGGAFEAIDELKARLVGSQAERVRRIETGELQVVGVNCFTETAESPLAPEAAAGDRRPSRWVRSCESIRRWNRNCAPTWRRGGRPGTGRRAAGPGRPQTSRRGVGQHHAGHHRPRSCRGDNRRVGRGIARRVRRVPGPDRRGRWRGASGSGVPGGCAGSQAMAARSGGPPKLLVAKPGLDGHSNGAEQIAVAARDAGFEVVYQGIRLSPAEIAAAARDEDVDVVGISILSGSHLELVPEVVDRLRAAGVEAPVVVGGIIPPEDADILLGKGVARCVHPQGLRDRPDDGRPGGAGRVPPDRTGRLSGLRPRDAPDGSVPAATTTAR